MRRSSWGGCESAYACRRTRHQRRSSASSDVLTVEIRHSAKSGSPLRSFPNVPLAVVKEVGLVVRTFKNKDVTLLYGGSFVTYKHLKMFVDLEEQPPK